MQILAMQLSRKLNVPISRTMEKEVPSMKILGMMTTFMVQIMDPCIIIIARPVLRTQ